MLVRRVLTESVDDVTVLVVFVGCQKRVQVSDDHLASFCDPKLVLDECIGALPFGTEVLGDVLKTLVLCGENISVRQSSCSHRDVAPLEHEGAIFEAGVFQLPRDGASLWPAVFVLGTRR